MRYLTIIFCAALVLFSFHKAQAEVPKLINYQGKLTTAEGACVDTTVWMQFAIYSDSTGGDSLWSETQSSVKVDRGVFNVLLGSVNEIPESVFIGDVRYLGVKVDNDPEMTPRKPIVSVPYAYKSVHADSATHFGIWPPAGKVYDSGWFPVPDPESNTITLAHNLGTNTVIAELWFSTSLSGSSAIRLSIMRRQSDDGVSACIRNLSSTHITIVTGYSYVAADYDNNGWMRYYASGYYRLLLLALE